MTTSPAVNPTPAQPPARPLSSLARNAFHLVLGQAGTMVLGILFSAALGRTLGVGDFGLYFLITSFSAFALVLVDWGQQYFGIREVARAPERGAELLGTGLVLRAVGTALVCLPIGLSAWALGYDRRTIGFAVAFVALNLPLFLAQNFAVVFRGQDRMGLDATVSVTNRAAGLVLALAALGLGLGLGGVVVAQGFAGCVALGVAIHLYRRVSHGPLRFTRATATEILTGGTAIVTMSLATNVQPYIDAILLFKLVPREAVGWYGAAKTVMGTLLAPSLILGAAAFPRLSRAAGNGPEFLREMRLAGRPMAWLGGLAAVGTWHFAPVAIKLIYGSKGDFGPAAIILSVFGLGLFLVFIDVLLGTSATAIGRSTPFSIIRDRHRCAGHRAGAAPRSMVPAGPRQRRHRGGHRVRGLRAAGLRRPALADAGRRARTHPLRRRTIAAGGFRHVGVAPPAPALHSLARDSALHRDLHGPLDRGRAPPDAGSSTLVDAAQAGPRVGPDPGHRSIRALSARWIWTSSRRPLERYRVALIEGTFARARTTLRDTDAPSGAEPGERRGNEDPADRKSWLHRDRDGSVPRERRARGDWTRHRSVSPLHLRPVARVDLHHRQGPESDRGQGPPRP